MGFQIFSQLFSIIWVLAFLVILGTIAYRLILSIRQRSRDNHSPRLTVETTIVAKRQDFYTQRANNATLHHTHYYVTFQVESGDRMELEVEGRDFGMLVEGDKGKLTFQGSRFLSFVRM